MIEHEEEDLQPGRLTPSLVRSLRSAARKYGDDRFFAIRSDDEWFVCNWVMGIRFHDGEILNCPHFDGLRDEADRISQQSDVKKDILYHLHKRSWMDLLVGTGIYQDAELVKLKPDEAAIFRERGWPVIPFETGNGRRYYVREEYFDIADKIVDDIHVAIFRPVISRTYPGDYRPVLFFDSTGTPRGMIHAITEENMRCPVDRHAEYSRYVEQEVMPELDELMESLG